MSVPHPQFNDVAVDDTGTFTFFWMDWMQRVYQALGLVNRTDTALTPHTFTAIAAGVTQSMAVTMKGTTANDDVTIGLHTLDIGLVYQAYVSANDTVTITCTNTTAASITPTAGSIRTTVRSFE